MLAIARYDSGTAGYSKGTLTGAAQGVAPMGLMGSLNAVTQGLRSQARYTPAYLLSLLTELSLLGQHGNGVNHIAVL